MLRKSLRIAAKELTAFFASPAAFLFLLAFLGVTLFVFFWGAAFFERNLADVRPLFQWMPVLLIFLVAALTMRSWAEERRAGTLELLLSSPTGPNALVLGKFLGCMALVAIALLLTLPLPITVSLLGPLDWGPVIGGYVAAIALAAAYVAIGLWVSCRTDNQIVSLILAVIIAGAFYLVGADTLTSLAGYRTVEWLHALGAGSRFAAITRGVLDLRDLYYYLSLTAVFLALNRLSLERLRWAGNPGQRLHRRWYWATALLAANVLGANLWLDQIGSARVDLTAGHLYTLSDATRNYLGQLREPLLIRGYFSANTHPLLAPLVPQLHDLLEEYAVAGGGRVHVEFIDPRDHPQLEAEAGSRYGIHPVPFQVSSKYQASVVNSYFDILVSYGDQYEVLDYRNLIDIKASGNSHLSVELKNPEYAITGAIRQVLQSYQGSGSLFGGLTAPLTFTRYVSTRTLPAQMRAVSAALDGALDQLRQDSDGKLQLQTLDPSTDPALAARLVHDYGFQPMVTSLLDTQPFWFYMTLGNATHTEQVPLPATLTQAGFKSALEAAVKRFSPGFLKTVAVVGPPSPSPFGGGGGGPAYSNLRQAMSGSVHWLDTDLANGQVPADADLLMLLDPHNLDRKQQFAVDQFLMQGGTVVIATAPTQISIDQSLDVQPVHSGLESWLAGYGIVFGRGMVLSQHSGALPIPVKRNVGGYTLNEIELARYPYILDVRGSDLNPASPITGSLGQIQVPWATPVLVDGARNRDRKVTPLLRSAADSWVSGSSDVIPDYPRYPGLGFPITGRNGAQPLAVMIEGRFDSAFKGQRSPLLPTGTSDTGGTGSSGTAAARARAPASGKRPHAAPIAHANSTAAAPDTSGTGAGAFTLSGVIDRSPDSARLIVIGSSALFSDQVMTLLGEAQGTRYLKPVEFAQNIVDWSLEDQGLLAIRSRAHFARTLEPLDRSAKQFWEYLNYALALFGLGLVYLASLWQRRLARARHLAWLREVR